MSRQMLIDATHPEETRVAVIENGKLEEFDFESSTKTQTKGGIYLAKVTRVEPSLQAAFLDYGGDKHGFLSFSEIHPDYYQIPTEDKEEFEKWLSEHSGNSELNSEDEESSQEQEIPKTKSKFFRRYRIQEVVKRRQVMLVQVIREERGNKGAALTTYISLAGRYCVLMPNSRKSGGISRKITNLRDRNRLKSVVDELKTPEGMSVVVRTAGMDRTKSEIKKDYEYLSKLWSSIRETTLKSTAPSLVYEEATLIKRSIRDMYTKDTDSILVEGEEGYKVAREFIKSLMPSHARRMQLYKDKEIPLFRKHEIEDQISKIYQARVDLNSGGYIIINSTEALVAIDVNSGKSTRERNVEETALRTNLEAAAEIPRQLRLRDLGGLIVIDFIDMHDHRHNASVERCIRETLKADRARVQMNKISMFGLLELSRQRIRPSIIESSAMPCPNCGGTGLIRSTESTSIQILRAVEDEGIRKEASEITVFVVSQVAFYLLNQKRDSLVNLEKRYGIKLIIEIDDSQSGFRIERTKLFPINIMSDQEDEVIEEKPQTPQIIEEKSMPKHKKQDSELVNKEASLEEAIKETSKETIKPKKQKQRRSIYNRKMKRRFSIIEGGEKTNNSANSTENKNVSIKEVAVEQQKEKPKQPVNKEKKPAKKGWWQKLLNS